MYTTDCKDPNCIKCKQVSKGQSSEEGNQCKIAKTVAHCSEEERQKGHVNTMEEEIVKDLLFAFRAKEEYLASCKVLRDEVQDKIKRLICILKEREWDLLVEIERDYFAQIQKIDCNATLNCVGKVAKKYDENERPPSKTALVFESDFDALKSQLKDFGKMKYVDTEEHQKSVKEKLDAISRESKTSNYRPSLLYSSGSLFKFNPKETGAKPKELVPKFSAGCPIETATVDELKIKECIKECWTKKPPSFSSGDSLFSKDSKETGAKPKEVVPMSSAAKAITLDEQKSRIQKVADLQKAIQKEHFYLSKDLKISDEDICALRLQSLKLMDCMDPEKPGYSEYTVIDILKASLSKLPKKASIDMQNFLQRHIEEKENEEIVRQIHNLGDMKTGICNESLEASKKKNFETRKKLLGHIQQRKDLHKLGLQQKAAKRENEPEALATQIMKKFGMLANETTGNPKCGEVLCQGLKSTDSVPPNKELLTVSSWLQGRIEAQDKLLKKDMQFLLPKVPSNDSFKVELAPPVSESTESLSSVDAEKDSSLDEDDIEIITRMETDSIPSDLSYSPPLPPKKQFKFGGRRPRFSFLRKSGLKLPSSAKNDAKSESSSMGESESLEDSTGGAVSSGSSPDVQENPPFNEQPGQEYSSMCLDGSKDEVQVKKCLDGSKDEVQVKNPTEALRASFKKYLEKKAESEWLAPRKISVESLPVENSCKKRIVPIFVQEIDQWLPTKLN